MAGKKKGTNGNKHKGVGRNDGPSRKKYWMSGKLQENKIRRMMRCNKLTRAEALVAWQDARQGRRTRSAAAVRAAGSVVSKFKVAS